MKLLFTGNAEASVTYLGKYSVETGSTLDVAEGADASALLQTGHFQTVDDNSDGSKTKDNSRKSDSSTKDDSTKGK